MRNKDYRRVCQLLCKEIEKEILREVGNITGSDRRGLNLGGVAKHAKRGRFPCLVPGEANLVARTGTFQSQLPTCLRWTQLLTASHCADGGLPSPNRVPAESMNKYDSSFWFCNILRYFPYPEFA